MSRKTFIIVTTISLLVLLGALVVYYLFLSPASQTTTGPVATIRQLFPFGTGGGQAGTTTEPIRPVVPEVVPAQNYTQKLRKVWSLPVAGVGSVDVKAGTVLRHIESATGHVYETELFSPNQNRISNTTIPQVYNAFWTSKNDSVVVERLSDDEQTVNSYTFSIKTATNTDNNVTGSLLGDRIGSISVFGDTVFYLQKLNNSSVGYISTAGSNKAKEVWNSPIKELNSQFVNKDTVALTTKPHESVVGYLYFLNTSNGQVKKVMNGVLGLSTLVRGGAQSLIYISQADVLSMYLYDVKKETAIILTPATFPEKCVWSKKDVNMVYCAVPSVSLDKTSLTKWYMGTITIIDDIWKYDLKNGTSNIISNLVNDSGGEGIDVIKPMLSENEQYLIFINKNDNSLWSLDLTK